MRYKTSIKEEAEAASLYFSKLVATDCEIEIKRVSPTRSLNQNNYLHLIITAFGLHFGYSLEEAKIIYKQINKHLYEYEKKGRTFYKSSADLSKEEMAASIDKFHKVSAENGCDLPLASDEEGMRRLENYIDENKRYL